MSEQRKTNRRDFIVGAATGVASVALLSTAACSEEEPKDQKPKSLSDNVGTSEDGKGVSITVNDVEGAEKLMDVNFTSKEREQIVEGIESQIEAMRASRAFAAPNELAPAQVFSPRIPGKDYGSQANNVSLRKASTPPLPSSADDIAFAPLTHLASWVKNKKISSSELTEIYLKRIATHGPRLECFVTVTADLARQQAKIADTEIANGRYRGPLHGIPYGVKDLMDTAGIKTTWGAMPYKDRVANQDAIIVTRLREAGAVLIGKTTCGALAYGDIWFDGKTRNPWNTEEGSSGSSAGSASATGAGLVGFSIGTETLGSIVSPSQRCGTTGLRPSFGRVARTGTMALCWSLDKIGPICRGVEDTALVLAAINGGDVTDPSSATTGFYYDGAADPKNLTIGFAPEWFENANAVERNAFETAKSLGFNLKEIKVPDINFGAMVQNLVAEAAAAFEELTLSNRDDLLVWQEAQSWPNSFRTARFLSAVDYINLDRMRRQAMIEMDAMFASVDAIIGPNYAGGMLTATNYTGQPQLTFRAGFQSIPSRTGFGNNENKDAVKHRVTHNFSVWAPMYQEHNALIVGRALEEALDVRDAKPRL